MKRLVHLFSLFLTIPIFGQTFIPGGNVNGTWDFTGSPYIITGDVYVYGGDSLTIEPGVEVIFQDNYLFEISGNLFALGNEAGIIRFTEADTSGYSTGSDAGWNLSISTDFINFYEKEIILDYCIIEYANTVSCFEMAYADLIISNTELIKCKSYGLSVFGFCEVEISHCTIEENKGGGINAWVTGATEDVTILGCTVRNNAENGISSAYGGGPVYIDSCFINGNSASGILTASDMTFSISNSTIENNGNFTINGGGISANGNCAVDNVIVVNNKAQNGGGMYLENSILNQVDIMDTRIAQNTAAQSGGGICGYYPDPVHVESAIIADNSALNGGGVYYYLGSYDKTFKNVMICGNHAAERGGGVYIYQNYDTVEFERTTIVDNTADIEGSALYSELTDISFNSGIMWGNGTSNLVASGGMISVSYSDIENGWSGTGNINGIPLFQYPSGKNYCLNWINYPQSDYTKSPCINSGDPSISPDPDSTVADMGARFFDHSAQVEHTLGLKVILQGPFSESQMNTDLYYSGFLPEQQPYFRSPWNHYSQGSNKSPETNHIVDWIFIEIRKYKDINDTGNYYVINRQAAYLLNNGDVRSGDGGSLPSFYTSEDDSLFILVFHRNHLPVLSSAPLNLAENQVTYDFSVNDSSAYGGAQSQTELIPGLWGMIAGDGNADFQVNSLDKNDIWLDQNGAVGYYSGDFNLDGTVNETDKTGPWNTNAGRGNVTAIKAVAPFQCGDVLFDERDGQQYNTVSIGSQCWMAENLNSGVYLNSSAPQTNNGILEKYCYDDLDYFCGQYGGLYQWEEMMAYVADTLNEGICPPNGGWRLPTDFDWKILEGNVDSQYGVGDPEWENLYKRGFDAGKNLKSQTDWNSNGNGTDMFGFTALPSGEWDYNSVFKFQHEYAAFFSTTPESENKAWGRVFGATFDESFRGGYHKTYGFSVRCLKD